jgi:hypothetical protein
MFFEVHFSLLRPTCTTMNDEDVFSFEDVDEGGRPRVTAPLPGSAASSRSFAAAPGALFARLPPSEPRPRLVESFLDS